MDSEQPRYAHDCAACVWLGQMDVYDLYFCLQGGGLPTVIARYGHEGAYKSGMALADVDMALHEARSRARLRGLL